MISLIDVYVQDSLCFPPTTRIAYGGGRAYKVLLTLQSPEGLVRFTSRICGLATNYPFLCLGLSAIGDIPLR